MLTLLRWRLRPSGVHRASDVGPLFAPDGVEVTPRDLRLGQECVRTFAVTGYPREVGGGWLEPLLTFQGRTDIAVHVHPLPNAVAADRLRRQRARLESSRRADAARGKLVDPDLEVAAADADDLARRVARGEGRLFKVGLYVTVRAHDIDSLSETCARLKALASSLLLDAHVTSFRSVQGWLSTLPIGTDLLQMHRTFDTAALAASFPFSSAEMASVGGVYYGRNLRSGGIVQFDRFAQPNHNMVVLARSGAGKSYFAMLDALRSLYGLVEVHMIDPEGECGRLARAVGGVHVQLGADGVRLNPFDLYLSDAASDALTRRALFLHTVVSVMLGEPLDAGKRAALDRAVIVAYNGCGITADPRTHRRPAPLLRDLAAALQKDDSAPARALLDGLAPFVSGTHRGIFDGPSTVQPSGHLVVYGLRDLADEVRPVGMLLTLEAIWRQVADPVARRQRIVVVDEAWQLMRVPAGAAFLLRLAKTARKLWAGMTVITQDIADLLGSDEGVAIVSNAAASVLLRQAPQAIDVVAEAFRLSKGEIAFLLGAATGEGILSVGSDRVAFRAEASPAEHRLVTSNPAELAELGENEVVA